MPQQFTVPQFLDVEDKIIGSVTTRQFSIIMAAALILFILYKILTFMYFVIFGAPILIIAAVFSFAKVNGMPFHFFFVNILQTLRRPKTRVWFKETTTAEINAILSAPPPPPPKIEAPKEAITGSRLQELTLVANTGGVYNPDDWK